MERLKVKDVKNCQGVAELHAFMDKFFYENDISCTCTPILTTKGLSHQKECNIRRWHWRLFYEWKETI